ncbi:hypothetical protein C5167_004211 [Papaver somniferum]|nr:hypothetical protein C5167_004211 [Papaver somniferum]
MSRLVSYMLVPQKQSRGSDGSILTNQNQKKKKKKKKKKKEDPCLALFEAVIILDLCDFESIDCI